MTVQSTRNTRTHRKRSQILRTLRTLLKVVCFGIPGVAVLSAALLWAFLDVSSAGPKPQSTSPGSGQSPDLLAETIGRLWGDDVTVSGAATFDVENGHSTAKLGSGSDLTVRSGQARVSLVEGGEIAICGPAHLSLLKSGKAITLALDYGRVRPELNPAISLMIYTPFIMATPVGIGQSPRDITVGLDVQGEMCALADRGAVRIEQQLSGRILLVPEGGQANLTNGELNSLASAHTCTCELAAAQNSVPTQLELSVPVHPPIASVPPPADPATAATPPIYHVDMPPLTFNSSSPAPPPDGDPQSILLARESRLQSDAVSHGQVVAAPAPPDASANTAAKTADTLNQTSTPKKHSVLARFLGLFRSHSAPQQP